MSRATPRMAGALALAVAATVVLVCLNAGTRSELLQEPAPEARRSEILAMNRELNLQQNLLDVAVRNAISAARKAGGAAGDAEKETLTQSLSSLPTDSAPNFAMIKSNWKSFSALPPSKRPGFGSAESSSDMDARIARLRAHQVDRDFERSAAAPTTQLSSSPHSPPPLSSPHSTRGMAGAAGAAGGVLVTGFVPAWRPWELCAVGAGARPDNNARLCSAFRSLGDAGEDGEGPASGGVSGVRFEPASGPVGAALAQVPEGARRATERLSAALKPLNTAQAKINLERLALARTMLDFNPYDFEAGGHTKDISGGNDGGYDAPYDLNGDGQDIDNFARATVDWSYTQPTEGYLFPYGPARPDVDMTPPVFWARGNARPAAGPRNTPASGGNRPASGLEAPASGSNRPASGRDGPASGPSGQRGAARARGSRGSLPPRAAAGQMRMKVRRGAMLAGWDPEWTKWAGWTAFTPEGAKLVRDQTGFDLSDEEGPVVETGAERAEVRAGDHHAGMGMGDGAPAYMNIPEEEDHGQAYTWQGKMSALLPTFEDTQGPVKEGSESESRWPLNDITAPAVAEGGVRAGDYMHHPVGATPRAEESFVNVPRERVRQPAVSIPRVDNAPWFQDEQHASGVNTQDPNAWQGTRGRSSVGSARNDVWAPDYLRTPRGAETFDVDAAERYYASRNAHEAHDSRDAHEGRGGGPASGQEGSEEEEEEGFWPLRDITAPAVAEGGVRAGDYMHHPVGATPVAQESFVNVPRERERVRLPAWKRSGAVEDNWPLQDISAPAVATGGVRAGDYMHHMVAAAPRPEESFLNIPREHVRDPTGHPGEEEDHWPLQDIIAPAAEQGGVRAGDYMHHAVGATPLAEESFVKIPREHARVPAQHQGEVQDNWPFQDTSPPAVEEGGMRAGDYMHHAVGATPLAEESFVNPPRAAAGDRTA